MSIAFEVDRKLKFSACDKKRSTQVSSGDRARVPCVCEGVSSFYKNSVGVLIVVEDLEASIEELVKPLD